MKQFQDESAATIEIPRFTRQSRPLGPQVNDKEAAIATLFVGIRLGRPLCDSHREFLDQMAPGRTITFLIQGQKYIHPADVELFPIDLIASSVNHDSQAFYSHRCRSTTRLSGTDCRVHTVVLNPHQPSPWILGFFGPDHELARPDFENGFFDSALQLREIFGSLDRVSGIIEERLGSPRAVIVVNRSSGRILAMNHKAEAMLGAAESEWLDREFGDLPANLFRMKTGQKLHIDNINQGEFHASVITVGNDPTPTACLSVDVDIIGQAREKIAGIVANARQVQSTVSAADEGALRSSGDEIIREANTLDSWLITLNLMRNIDQIPVRPVSIGQQLNRAIDTVNARVERDPEIVQWRCCHDAGISVPEDSLVQFFEAVLMDHSDAGANGATVVSLTSDPEGQQLLVTVATTGKDDITDDRLQSMWARGAEQLARLIGIRMERKLNTEHNQITTEIIIET